MHLGKSTSLSADYQPRVNSFRKCYYITTFRATVERRKLKSVFRLHHKWDLCILIIGWSCLWLHPTHKLVQLLWLACHIKPVVCVLTYNPSDCLFGDEDNLVQQKICILELLLWAQCSVEWRLKFLSAARPTWVLIAD